MQKSIDDIDFDKSGGLVPVIVQDVNTKDVLTLAYANKESLELAKKTGYDHTTSSLLSRF